jgi:hypothetical protein
MSKNSQDVGLSQAELSRFETDGFIVVDDLFSVDEVEKLRRACSAPEDQQWEGTDHLIHALELTVRHRRYPEHPFGHAWNQEGGFARQTNKGDGVEWLGKVDGSG